MSIVRCDDVWKHYGAGEGVVTALRGVAMSIDRPGFYAIMGQSGSGKSSLLHLLASLDRPDRGEIEIGGQRIDRLDERGATEFRRRGIGIVFQQFNLIPTLTARENVELPGLLAGDAPAALAARSGELLDRLGLGARAGHRPQALSGGEQQRVAIARALLYNPPVLLADEPTGNLDSASSARLWTLLGEIAAESGTTVVMVTHEPEAASHCRITYVLRDGLITDAIETEGLDAGGVAARYNRAGSAA